MPGWLRATREVEVSYPMPVLDHIVVNVHQRMDEAEAAFRGLGFNLTPRGYHTLGSINHLAIFATDYLELIALPEDATGRKDLLAWPMGWNGVVFNTEDAETLSAQLRANGVEASLPNDFSRPVPVPGGTADAVFRTVRLPNETTAAGRIYFCEHKTRGLVWRDADRFHANGVRAIGRIEFRAPDPGRLAGVFRGLFGPESVPAIAGGYRLTAGLVAIDVLAGEGPERIAKVEFRGGTAGRAEAMGAVLEFTPS